MITKDYAGMKYVELKAEAQKRHLPLRGSKEVLIQRLIAHDEGRVHRAAKEEAPKPDDRIVSTAGGKSFTICGGCEKWDRRCSCKDGEITEKPGPSGSSRAAKTSTKATGPGQNSRARRYIHRGTFA